MNVNEFKAILVNGGNDGALTVTVTTASPSWLCIATGGSACDVTHSITSIIQFFLCKCNNSKSCKLFYLDYKSANSQMTSNAIHSVSFGLPGLSAGKYSLLCIPQIYLMMSDVPCWQILHRRSGIISIHVTHPRLYKCLQVHVIANARLVRCVLVRLSPNWPNTSKTAVNGRC